MIDLNLYINEKLIIDKDVKSTSKKKQEINDKFISALTNFLKNNHKITVGRYPDTISVCGKNNDFILLTLSKNNRYKYNSIMSFIDEFYQVRKKCSTNNQSIYIYPDYEKDNDYIQEKLIVNNNVSRYNYHPKDKEELKDLIDKLIKERGDDANLNDIDTSKITDMSKLFKFSYFNGNISKWDVSNVETMKEMFFNCSNFSCDLNNWDVSNVKDFSHMFRGCIHFNGNICDWNVSNAENMYFMFKDCYKFNQDISKWDVSNVTDMESMFSQCLHFNQDLENWNVNSKCITAFAFSGCNDINKKPSWQKNR